MGGSGSRVYSVSSCSAWLLNGNCYSREGRDCGVQGVSGIVGSIEGSLVFGESLCSLEKSSFQVEDGPGF